MSTYLGSVMRISKKNKVRLEAIKEKRNFKSIDSVISKLLKSSEFTKKSRKNKKPFRILDQSNFGL